MFFDISDVFWKTVDAALTKIGIRVVSDKTLLMMQIFMTFAKGQGHSDLLKMIKNAINDIFKHYFSYRHQTWHAFDFL